MRTFCTFLAFIILSLPLLARQERFYLGTYTSGSPSKGIYTGTLDSQSGKLGALALAAAASDPSFIALSPKEDMLYAVEESPNLVQAFRRRLDDSLMPMNQQPTGGTITCHLSVDPKDRDVLVASYGNGNIACFRLQPDGAIGARTALIQLSGSGPDRDRQQGPHAHSIYVSPDDAFVYTCDLGSDRVWSFKFDAAAGSLTPTDPPYASVPPGSGPRHLAFAQGGKIVYVANEMGHSVTVFSRDAVTGKLTALETVPTLPEGTPPQLITIAEVVVHPSGKWLYVSNRGVNTISVFAIGADGRIKMIQNVPDEVNFPRSFSLDTTGRWMITAGQKDNRIAVLKVDPATGKLSATPESAEVGSPVCVLFPRK